MIILDIMDDSHVVIFVVVFHAKFVVKRTYLFDNAILLYRRFAYLYRVVDYIHFFKLKTHKIYIPKKYQQITVYLFGYIHYLYYAKKHLFRRCKALVEYTENMYSVKLHKFFMFNRVFKYLVRRLVVLRQIRHKHFKRHVKSARNTTEVPQKTVLLQRSERIRHLKKHYNNTKANITKYADVFNRVNALNKVTYLRRAFVTCVISNSMPVSVVTDCGCSFEIS